MWMDTLGALATANLRNGDDSFVRNRRVHKAEEEFERATRPRDHVHAAAVEALSQYVKGHPVRLRRSRRR